MTEEANYCDMPCLQDPRSHREGRLEALRIARSYRNRYFAGELWTSEQPNWRLWLECAANDRTLEKREAGQ